MTNWIASPQGSDTGAGTVASPWSLKKALSPGTGIVLPGDQILLRGGIFVSPGPYVWVLNLQAPPEKKIVVRPFAGEKPILDLRSYDDNFFIDNPKRGSFVRDNCHGVQFWMIEFMSSTTQRSSNALSNNGMPNGITVTGEDIEFIHCYVHDIGNWIWTQLSKNGRAYGNIAVNFGWLAPDRGHGHCFYIENDGKTGSVKEFENNFCYGSYDIAVQEYGAAALTENIHFRKNTVGGGGEKTGVSSIQYMCGQNRPIGMITDGNNFFTPPNISGVGFVQVGWQWDAENHDVSFQDNLVVGPEVQVGNWDNATIEKNRIFTRVQAGNLVANPLSLYTYSPATGQSVKKWLVDNNEYGPGKLVLGSRHVDSAGNAVSDGGQGFTDPTAWKTAIGGDANSKFASTPAFTTRINPSTQIPGIVHITIWNPAKLPTVPIDFTGIATQINVGDAYELRDVLNFNGPAILSGKWDGSVLQVPTNLTRGSLVGTSTPPHTAPEWLMFQLRAGKALDGTWIPINGVSSPVGPPEPPPPPVPVLAIGVTVALTPTLNTGLGVRVLPDTSTPHFAVEMIPATGLITAGPTNDTATVNPFGPMWTVKFADATGWCVAKYLVPTTIVTPPPPPPSPITIGITPQTATAAPGVEVDLTAVTNDVKGVTWQGSGTINAAGGFAFKAILPGTYTVTCTSVTDPTKVASATITVSAVVPPPQGGAGTYAVTGSLTLK
jgi:hypothetical protein